MSSSSEGQANSWRDSGVDRVNTRIPNPDEAPDIVVETSAC